MLQHLKWLHFNSFVTKLAKIPNATSLAFPIRALRTALEEPTKEFALTCRLQVAAEWMTHCAEDLYWTMKGARPLDSNEPSLEPGPGVGEHIRTRSIERWMFWKTWLAEYGSDQELFKIDDAVLGQIKKAIRRMEEAESTDESLTSIRYNSSEESFVEHPWNQM